MKRWIGSVGGVLTLVLVAAIGYGARDSAGQQAAQPSTEQLMIKTLTDLDGRQIALTKLVYPPGAGVMEHRHRAYIAAYVVSGHVESALDDEKPIVYGPGEVWYESHMQLHRTFRNPSTTEPFVVIVFALRDAAQPAK